MVIDHVRRIVYIPMNSGNNAIKEANAVAKNLGFTVVFIQDWMEA